MTIDSLIAKVREIKSISDIAEFKSCVNLCYEWLRDNFNNVHVDELVVARSNFTDALLCHAWEILHLDKQKNLTLCAVGGYGRGQLQPYSDIDLLILSKSSLPKAIQDDLSLFITFLWDIKLEIGQSVRTVKETIAQAKDDITIATNLVEARRLCGCENTFDDLITKINSQKFWSSQAFFWLNSTSKVSVTKSLTIPHTTLSQILKKTLAACAIFKMLAGWPKSISANMTA